MTYAQAARAGRRNDPRVMKNLQCPYDGRPLTRPGVALTFKIKLTPSDLQTLDRGGFSRVVTYLATVLASGQDESNFTVRSLLFGDLLHQEALLYSRMELTDALNTQLTSLYLTLSTNPANCDSEAGLALLNALKTNYEAQPHPGAGPGSLPKSFFVRSPSPQSQHEAKGDCLHFFVPSRPGLSAPNPDEGPWTEIRFELTHRPILKLAGDHQFFQYRAPDFPMLLIKEPEFMAAVMKNLASEPKDKNATLSPFKFPPSYELITRPNLEYAGILVTGIARADSSKDATKLRVSNAFNLQMSGIPEFCPGSPANLDVRLYPLIPPPSKPPKAAKTDGSPTTRGKRDANGRAKAPAPGPLRTTGGTPVSDPPTAPPADRDVTTPTVSPNPQSDMLRKVDKLFTELQEAMTAFQARTQDAHAAPLLQAPSSASGANMTTGPCPPQATQDAESDPTEAEATQAPTNESAPMDVSDMDPSPSQDSQAGLHEVVMTPTGSPTPQEMVRKVDELFTQLQEATTAFKARTQEAHAAPLLQAPSSASGADMTTGPCPPQATQDAESDPTEAEATQAPTNESAPMDVSDMDPSPSQDSQAGPTVSTAMMPTCMGSLAPQAEPVRKVDELFTQLQEATTAFKARTQEAHANPLLQAPPTAMASSTRQPPRAPAPVNLLAMLEVKQREQAAHEAARQAAKAQEQALTEAARRAHAQAPVDLVHHIANSDDSTYRQPIVTGTPNTASSPKKKLKGAAAKAIDQIKLFCSATSAPSADERVRSQGHTGLVLAEVLKTGTAADPGPIPDSPYKPSGSPRKHREALWRSRTATLQELVTECIHLQADVHVAYSTYVSQHASTPNAPPLAVRVPMMAPTAFVDMLTTTCRQGAVGSYMLQATCEVLLNDGWSLPQLRGLLSSLAEATLALQSTANPHDATMDSSDHEASEDMDLDLQDQTHDAIEPPVGPGTRALSSTHHSGHPAGRPPKVPTSGSGDGRSGRGGRSTAVLGPRQAGVTHRSQSRPRYRAGPQLDPLECIPGTYLPERESEASPGSGRAPSPRRSLAVEFASLQ